ncbi:hypothetical protein C882_1877 [Caenispirillum salinarum AK4]|uniref:Uncharacterized protein n=1 Tax=Caenispirillum salinarum AK4 TaxID=1238182 RepID=K9GN15_9PROT|nr:hypothetical protein [Caenispirillum salinarum]EKV27375.1 hypothetical protein C882_1877 [Caenispirillum salinarum AK4]
MADYGFYIAQLRFVARTTDRVTPQVAEMMDELARIADAIAAEGYAFTVPAGRLRIAGRALAGVAGLMQKQILPEAVAAGNAAGEAQVRWTIDTSMEAVANITVHAELTGDGEDYRVILPPPPGAKAN